MKIRGFQDFRPFGLWRKISKRFSEILRAIFRGFRQIQNPEDESVETLASLALG